MLDFSCAEGKSDVDHTQYPNCTARRSVDHQEVYEKSTHPFHPSATSAAQFDLKTQSPYDTLRIPINPYMLSTSHSSRLYSVVKQHPSKGTLVTYGIRVTRPSLDRAPVSKLQRCLAIFRIDNSRPVFLHRRCITAINPVIKFHSTVEAFRGCPDTSKNRSVAARRRVSYYSASWFNVCVP